MTSVHFKIKDSIMLLYVDGEYWGHSTGWPFSDPKEHEALFAEHGISPKKRWAIFLHTAAGKLIPWCGSARA